MRIDLLNLPKEYIGLPKRLGLEFKLGEILEARVLKAGAERALLQLKGQKILADVKTNLQPGDAIKVRVTGEFQNQVVLKVLAEAAPAASPAEQLLRQAGYTPNDETRTALAFLLKNGLPVTPGTVQTLLTDQAKALDQILTRLFLAHTPTASATPANEPTDFLQPSKGFTPAKAEILELLKQAASQNTQTPETGDVPAEKKSPVAQQNTGAQPKTGSGAEQPAAQTRSTATQEAVVEQIIAQPDRTLETGATTTLKPTLSRQDAALLKAVADQQTSSTLTNTDAGKHAPAKTNTTPDKLVGLHSPAQNTGGEAKANQAQTPVRVPVPQTLNQLEHSGLILNPARNLPELVRGIKLLMQNFGLPQNTGANSPVSEGQLDLTTLLSPPLNEPQTEAVKDLSDKLLAMRMHHKEPGVLLHMEIPLLFGSQLRTGVLQIRDDENQHTLALEDRPLSILFRLETEELGQLRVVVLLRNQEVNCQFAADREEIRRLLRQSVPDLQSRFEAMSYQVSHMGISQLTEKEVTRTEPLPGQVDFRV